MFKKIKETDRKYQRKNCVCQGRHTSKNRDCVVGGAYRNVSFGVIEFYGYRPTHDP